MIYLSGHGSLVFHCTDQHESRGLQEVDGKRKRNMFNYQYLGPAWSLVTLFCHRQLSQCQKTFLKLAQVEYQVLRATWWGRKATIEIRKNFPSNSKPIFETLLATRGLSTFKISFRHE